MQCTHLQKLNFKQESLVLLSQEMNCQKAKWPHTNTATSSA